MGMFMCDISLYICVIVCICVCHPMCKKKERECVWDGRVHWLAPPRAGAPGILMQTPVQRWASSRGCDRGGAGMHGRPSPFPRKQGICLLVFLLHFISAFFRYTYNVKNITGWEGQGASDRAGA